MALLAVAHWIYDFQTLITGLLAVGAALYAAKFAQGQIKVGREQIEAAKEQADRERAARLRAARASLPTTLSSICEYAQDAGSILHKAWPLSAKLYPHEDRSLEHYTITADVPAFPVELLSALERIVELTDVDAVATRIESLLREVQVFSARTRGLRNGERISLEWMANHILQAATIYARAESLLPYSRRSLNDVEPTDLWVRVSVALGTMGVRDGFVFNEMVRQRNAGLAPGEGDTSSEGL